MSEQDLATRKSPTTLPQDNLPYRNRLALQLLSYSPKR